VADGNRKGVGGGGEGVVYMRGGRWNWQKCWRKRPGGAHGI
jgi:hypothetical protein